MEFAGTYWGSCSAIFSFLCIFCRSWFFLFSYYPCIICPSSIDCFWLPLLLSSNLSCVWHGLCRQWWLESWLVHYQYIKNNKGPFKHQAQRFQYRTMFMSFNSNTTGVISGTGTDYSSGEDELSGACNAWSLVFYVVFYRSLFVLFSFFFWPLYCLFFFHLRILLTPSVSSSFFLYRVWWRLKVIFSMVYIFTSISWSGMLVTTDRFVIGGNIR